MTISSISSTAERLLRGFSATLDCKYLKLTLARTRQPPPIHTVWMHSKLFSCLLPQSFLIKIHKKFLSQCLHTPVNMSNKEIVTRGSLLTCSSLKMSTHAQRLKENCYYFGSSITTHSASSRVMYFSNLDNIKPFLLKQLYQNQWDY